MDADAVRERVGSVVDRFAEETGWEVGPGGGEPPGPLRTLRDLPKRGPAHLLARLGLQHLRDVV